MHNFIQRNKKKLLAVFGVLLMIVFILPTTFSGRSMSDATVGKVGDAKLTGADLQQASHELRALAVLGQTMVGQSPDDQSNADLMVGLFQRFYEKPITYLVLQKEAEAAGVVPSPDAVEVMATDLQGVPNIRTLEVDPQTVARHFLQVRGNFDRARGRIKVTLPEVQQVVAARQVPTANIVEFKADEYLASAGEPKPEDVESVYARFAKAEPRAGATFAATQPVRFGYLRPTRVKLQYLQIPKAKLGEAAVAGLTPDELYDLDRVAVGYYKANPTEFEVKPDERVLGPTTAPAVKRFATARDEIRRKLLLDKAAQPAPDTSAELSAKLQTLRTKVDKRIDELRTQVADKLAADFRAHQKGEQVSFTPLPATQPTTAPATQPATFESPEYLDAVLAGVVQKAGGPGPATNPAGSQPAGGETVVPARYAKALDDKWYTAEALNDVEGINLASTGTDTFAKLAIRINPSDKAATVPATSATASAAPSSASATAPAGTNPSAATATAAAAAAPTTAPAGGPAAASAWALYQPSPLLVSTSAGDAYVFRLTAFEGERVPSLDEVRPQIVRDLKQNEAFTLAAKAAQTLLEGANSTATRPEGGLPHVADLTGRKVIVAGPLDPQFPGVPGYPTADLTSGQILQAGIMSLVGKATTAQPHPSTPVPLAAESKVLAVELRSLERSWMKDKDFVQQREIAQRARQSQERRLVLDWFAPESVAKRTSYVPAGG